MFSISSTQDSHKWGHILVAEDEKPLREMIVDWLHEEGYLCDEVGTAQDARIALAAKPYDLFITDIHMPDNRSLASLQSGPGGASSIPIIVLTGQPCVETAVEAVRLGVVDYLIKPVERPVLCKSVEMAIGKGRLLRSLRKTRDEMRIWTAAIDGLEKALTAADRLDIRAGRSGPMARALDQTITLYDQIETSLQTMLQLANRLGGGQKHTAEGALDQQARLAAYEEALRHTVETLMTTRNVFKSKEIGDLRKMLERVLKRDAKL